MDTKSLSDDNIVNCRKDLVILTLIISAIATFDNSRVLLLAEARMTELRVYTLVSRVRSNTRPVINSSLSYHETRIRSRPNDKSKLHFTIGQRY